MRLRLLAALAALAMATGVAQAQIGIYATPTFSRISNSTADNGVFAFLGSGNTSGFFKGASFGIYDDFFHTPRFDAGADIRAGFLRGGGAQFSDFLIGARVVYKPATLHIRPYAELLGGVGGSKPAHNPRSVSKGLYSISAGVDYPFARHVDFRVVEIGYSSVQTINSSTVTTQADAFPSSKLLNFSTGLVFRF